MTLEELPEVTDLEIDRDHAEFMVLLHGDLLFFQGHFPNGAILPGVAQIHWAMQWGRRYLDIERHFVGLDQVKFHMPAKPGDQLLVALDWEAEKSLLSFRYTLAGRVVSSGRIRVR
jgi:3-hydroxymyristoyl/3-hydroxydecanoyl-(acyl carrier protein) dehydratase